MYNNFAYVLIVIFNKAVVKKLMTYFCKTVSALSDVSASAEGQQEVFWKSFKANWRFKERFIGL
jgi:hypothetical protein